MENSVCITEGQRQINVRLKQSKRARNIAIKINSLTRIVELIIPPRVTINKAHKFLTSKHEWIWNQVAKFEQQIKYQHQAIIPIFDHATTIIHSGRIRGLSHIENNQLIISGLEEHLPRKVNDFLHQYLKQFIISYINEITPVLKVKCTKISIRNITSRWGSCSSSGALSFCFRLVFAPEFVIKYVVAHEMCHLIEMNHSSNFWRLVESIDPAYQMAKMWLKNNGPKLYSFG
jgi:predicted metal-dependent hydrolase